ncbi:D-amino-acid oxidase [Madurella mycetomatis]|uniref:D-amino-acid oxidase n=1 Tax=Madurella mycetomatis TaxID=100816 RepID=A0A175VY81_9PEZI|nr:D-amino-acid oxidase [Madurella mycetomatis]
MTKVTIFGAGITGMSIAFLLPKSHSITIVARNLPGDPPRPPPSSKEEGGEWASPYACAGWVALGGAEGEQRMQLDALAFLRKLAASHPESSVRVAELTDVYDSAVGVRSGEEVWYRGRVPRFEVLDDGTAARAGEVIVKYESVVLNPTVFLPWLRARLEAQGVKFQRVGTVKALAELAHLGHDVLINASGAASLTLEDVRDAQVVTDRTYTLLVKSEYRDMFVHRGAAEYTYVFGRQDGTAVVGGISEPVDTELRLVEDVRDNLFRRAHKYLPENFPSANPADYSVVRDLMGIRPLRLPNVRVEKDVIGGQHVIHAYGTTMGGYIYSFGLARETARLLDEYVFAG